MEIEFDPAKDAANIEKHGISLARAAEIEVLRSVRIERNGEARLKVMGLIDGRLFALVFVFRPNAFRAISLRRARPGELSDG